MENNMVVEQLEQAEKLGFRVTFNFFKQTEHEDFEVWRQTMSYFFVFFFFQR